MNRRQWLRGLAAALFSVAGAAWLPGCSRDESKMSRSDALSADSKLGRVLRNHFSYLDFDDAVLAAFVRDHETKHGPFLPRPDQGPFTRFLASTDFFQQGADESLPLRYVAYYDPYVSPCYNPFSTGPVMR